MANLRCEPTPHFMPLWTNSIHVFIGALWNPPTMIKTTRTYPEEFESRRLILNYEKSEYLARGGCPTKNPIAKRYFLLTFDELQKNVNILLIHLNIDNLWKLQSKSVNCWSQWVSGHCRKWTLWLVNHHIFCTTKKPVSWSLPDVTGTKSCNGSLCPGLEICLGTTANVYKKNTNTSLSVSLSLNKRLSWGLCQCLHTSSMSDAP